ncbi:hypothetical protein ScPMuIL_018260 [Solemya velum]
MSVKFLCAIYFTFLVVRANPRKVDTLINPDCTKDCGDGIGYFKAVGAADDLHYLISSIGMPTILVVRTDQGASVKPEIDWPKLLSRNESEIRDSITFGDKIKIKYSFAIVFPKLYEYNDTKDYADVMMYKGNATNWNIYDFTNFTWDAIGENSNVDLNYLKIMATQQLNTTFQNGTLAFEFNSYDHEARQNDLPHLQYNENNTIIDFLIDHVTPVFKKSRFALEAIFVSADNTTDDMEISVTTSIDDEYSPGVFKMTNWVTRPHNLDETGYAQWKPVCYLKSARSRSDGTKMITSPLQRNSTHLDMEGLKQTIAYAYFGDKLLNMEIGGTNLSFGLSQDGFYTKTEHTAWTFLVGFGDPPQDQVSLLVIIVISVGLGLPVLFIIFGGVFICVKKHKDKKKNEDDVTSDSPSVN